MDKARKKNIKRIISLVCAVILVIVLAAMPLIARNNPEVDGPQASILTHTASISSIQTALIGGGILSVAKMAGEIILYRVYDLGTVFLNEHIVSCMPEFNLDMSFAAVFAVLYLLSYVFRYGEELQKQSDETL